MKNRKKLAILSLITSIGFFAAELQAAPRVLECSALLLEAPRNIKSFRPRPPRFRPSWGGADRPRDFRPDGIQDGFRSPWERGRKGPWGPQSNDPRPEIDTDKPKGSWWNPFGSGDSETDAERGDRMVKERLRRYKEDMRDRAIRRLKDSDIERARKDLRTTLGEPPTNRQRYIKEDYLKDSLFILPPNDGEALMSLEMLVKAGAPNIHVSRQGWGALLSREELYREVLDEVKRVVIFEMPSPEVEDYLRKIGLEVVVVDHHSYDGIDRSSEVSAIEQLANLIGYTMGKAEKAMAANDQSFIQGLKAIGLEYEQILAVRSYDLIAQKGLRLDEIKRIRKKRVPKIIEEAEIVNGVYVFKGVSGLELTLAYEELGLRVPDGKFNAINIEPPGKIGFSGDKDFIKTLLDIDFPAYGFLKGTREEGGYALYTAGGGTLFGFKPSRMLKGFDKMDAFKEVEEHIMKMIETSPLLANVDLAVLRNDTLEKVSAFNAELGDQPVELEDLHYQVFGEANTSKPPLVLIHGLDSAYQTFENVIPELSKDRQVIVLDQRGHGQSADKSKDFSSLAMAGDLEKVLNALGVEKADILGHSMGARTATRFAALFPDRVNSLIIEDMELMARVRRATLANPDFVQELFAKSAEMKRVFENTVFENRKALVDALRPYYGDEAETLPERRAKELEDGRYMLLFRPWVSVLYGYQGNLEDFTQELQALKMPILVMKSNKSLGTALSDVGAAHIKKNAPEAQIVNFVDAGHTIHRADEFEFLKVLLSFLTRNEISQGQSATEQGNDVVKIKDAGTEQDIEVRERSMLPRGSALMTGSGDLAKQGITNIIHAASGAMAAIGGVFEPTIESVGLSTTNSIDLAIEAGHTRVAVPFVGGAIFANRIGTEPEKIAKSIIDAAVAKSDQIQIRFVTFGDTDTKIFTDILERDYPERDGKKVKVENGSITDYALHGASAIINAANMEVRFGGGLSHIIGKASGQSYEIDKAAAAAIQAYYEAKK